MSAQVHDVSVPASSVRQQVERILHSGELSGSEVLRNLLSFLTQHTLDRPGETAKEYDLAVGVLGKPAGFDPRLDSAVRVHTARLRAKLAEYYMSDGADDPILIEVPKGSYQIMWRLRGANGFHAVETPVPLPAPVAVQPIPVRGKWFAAGFAAAAVLACGAAGIWSLTRPKPVPAQVETFWQPFLRSPQAPIIVFSNHRFVGTSATGLHSFREGIDAPSETNDTYSGTGTVMAVAELSDLFALQGRTARLKRAELLTWDEAKDANLIFVGAPDANSRLKELAPLQHFRFKSSYDEPRAGTSGIVNVHAAPGEESIYFGSAKPYAFDYAVIALLPSFRADRKVVILAGMNTYGCQAAAEFVNRADRMGDLYARLGVPKNGAVPDFEALVKVGISGGVPLQPSVVTVRIHK